MTFPEEYISCTHRISLQIRDQESLDCCGALVAADLVSFGLKLTNPLLTDFEASPQEIIDMDTTDPLYANLYSAMNYVKNHGITLESAYGFVPRIKELHEDKNPPPFPRIRITEVVDLFYASATQIRAALIEQPIGGRIQFSQSFRNWKGNEIFREHSENSDDLHAISILGIDKDEYNTEFYYIKNSWGEGWGHKGYGRVATYLIKTTCYPTGIMFN